MLTFYRSPVSMPRFCASLLNLLIPITIFMISAVLLPKGAHASENISTTVSLTFKTKPQVPELIAEIADTRALRSKGLMQREHLGENNGMLFIYGKEQGLSSAFWMYRTLIPIDIAFMDKQGVIKSIKNMTICQSENSAKCPVYRSDEPYWSALEVNAGYFLKHNIGVGDQLNFSDVN